MARVQDALLIVDDSVAGAYFRFRLHDDVPPIIPLKRKEAELVVLSKAHQALDPESIDRLADGRIVILSEHRKAIYAEEGLVVQYDEQLAERAKRGLEGLAVRPLPRGVSRIAVLWEGGYPDPRSRQAVTKAGSGWPATKPFILVHDLAPGAVGVEVSIRDALGRIPLDVHQPVGREPQAQRFRAPDLVWYPLPPEQATDWGFMVLLSSGSYEPNPRFLHHWLQRFDAAGRPRGDPLDLKEHLPPELGRANWEGMCWFEPGRSVVLVHERQRGLPASAFLLVLPDSWRFAPNTNQAANAPSRAEQSALP